MLPQKRLDILHRVKIKRSVLFMQPGHHLFPVTLRTGIARRFFFFPVHQIGESYIANDLPVEIQGHPIAHAVKHQIIKFHRHGHRAA